MIGDAEEKSPRSTAFLLTTAAWAAATLLLAGRLTAALPSFREILVGLGATTPPVTMMVLNTPHVWWLLAAASAALFAWVAAKSRVGATERERMKLALGVLIALTVVAYGFAAYWLYLPMHMMGATV